nr:MFS transporter [Paenibacillus sp. SYP-B3998]
MLVFGVICIAANLRAPLTSVGPLVASIRDDMGISNTLAGMITTLPLLAFAILSPFAPTLARRFGIESVLLGAMGLLTIGIFLRSVSGIVTLFAGTALLGLGISVCNVLLPSLIKREFPDRIGLMTGMYSVGMNVCGAIASGISVPLSRHLGLGWKGALGCWAILAFFAILVWLPQMRNRHRQTTTKAGSRQKGNLWRSPLAWQVTLFMGLQSMIFYVIITWLPEILRERGISSDIAGWLLFLMQVALLPVTFIVPIIAGRMKSQHLLVLITGGLFFVGISGLCFGGSSWIPLWAIFLGMGGGCSFSLAMMFFGLRTHTSHEAAELSGMAQSFGYLLAAVGPILFGALHDATHSWTLPLIALMVVSVLILLFGLGAARDRYVGAK